MSKKKFKKFSKAEIMAELAKVNPGVQKEQTEVIKPRERVERKEIIQIKNADTKNAVPDFSKNTKTDLKKIGLLFGSLTLVLIVIDFISMKTDLINNLGNFLFKIFHLY